MEFTLCFFLRVKVQLEMLQMDLDDNDTTMKSLEASVEELQGTVQSLEAQRAQNQRQMSHMEATLEDSKAQVCRGFCSSSREQVTRETLRL